MDEKNVDTKKTKLSKTKGFFQAKSKIKLAKQ